MIAILSDGFQPITAVVSLTLKHTAHPLGYFPTTDEVLLDDAQVLCEDQVIKYYQMLTCGAQTLKGRDFSHSFTHCQLVGKHI